MSSLSTADLAYCQGASLPSFQAEAKDLKSRSGSGHLPWEQAQDYHCSVVGLYVCYIAITAAQVHLFPCKGIGRCPTALATGPATAREH